MQPLFLRSSLYDILFASAYCAWFLPELLGNMLDRYGGRHPRRERSYDRGSGVLIGMGISLLPFGAIAIAILVGAADIADRARVAAFSGIALIPVGIALRWWAVASLGRQFSRRVAIQTDHSVVTSGPYRLIRHPSYTGTMLTLAGIGLAAENWLSVILLVVGGALIYSYRVTVEERVLAREIGEPYLSYMRKTKRFIPWLL